MAIQRGDPVAEQKPHTDDRRPQCSQWQCLPAQTSGRGFREVERMISTDVEKKRHDQQQHHRNRSFTTLAQPHKCQRPEAEQERNSDSHQTVSTLRKPDDGREEPS